MAEPMYWRIAQDLRHEIEGGKLRPGQQLPTELELREKYGASRNTIRDAMKWLASRAMVDSRPGQGTFVAEHRDTFVTTLSADIQTGRGGGEGLAADAEISARGHRAAVDPPRVELQRAADRIAERLRVAAGSLIISRHQARYIDGAPWSLQTSFYPMDLVTRGAQGLLLAEDIAQGTVTYLHETLGLAQVGYRDTILVRPPDQNEAGFLGLPDDGRIPVAVIIRTGYTDSPDGPAPFRVTVSVFPADRNQFVMNSGAVPGDLAGPARRPNAMTNSPGHMRH
jgi:GntR family transcriptional regulator